MENRIVRLYLPQASLADFLTANQIGKLLSSMHPNTEIISMGHDPSTAGFYVTFYNPEYKEVPQHEVPPNLTIFEATDEDPIGTDEVEFFEHMGQIGVDWFDPTANQVTSIGEYSFHPSFEQVQKSARKYFPTEIPEDAGTLTGWAYYNPMNNQVPVRRGYTNYIIDEEIKDYSVIDSLHSLMKEPEPLQAYIDAIKDRYPPFTSGSFGGPSKSCEHNWVPYQGLSQSYDYCSKCDEKREDN